MEKESTWRWTWGMVYIVLVAVIWIGASFVVQSVVDAGVSPFLITYICNSLFVVYIPLVEGGRWFERVVERNGWVKFVYKKFRKECEKVTEMPSPQQGHSSEKQNLLESVERDCGAEILGDEGITVRNSSEDHELQDGGLWKHDEVSYEEDDLLHGKADMEVHQSELEPEILDEEPWTWRRTAMVGLIICPFWFLAQLTFNFSLKLTTVTSNTILSTTSSLFTLLVSVQFLGERFTWVKLVSVLLCMLGTIIVSLGDSWKGTDASGPNAFVGDLLCLVSAMFYATYTALIRVHIPDEEDGKGKASTALVFGYIGLFNALVFGPIALLLHFTGVEPFHRLTPYQVALIIGKGLLDNVLSDYLWARAVLLTSPTAATAGLTIQVPIAALIDSIRGKVPSSVNLIGAVAVLVGFFGINQSDQDPFPPRVEEESVSESDGNGSLVVSSSGV